MAHAITPTSATTDLVKVLMAHSINKAATELHEEALKLVDTRTSKDASIVVGNIVLLLNRWHRMETIPQRRPVNFKVVLLWTKACEPGNAYRIKLMGTVRKYANLSYQEVADFFNDGQFPKKIKGSLYVDEAKEIRNAIEGFGGLASIEGDEYQEEKVYDYCFGDMRGPIA